MGIFQLFMTATFPVLNVLLVTSVGLFIASDYIGILGEEARKHLNDVVYYVFNPALLFSNLSKALTSESVATSWFIPANILLTFILGSAFGLLLIQITKPPSHLKGLTLCCCAAGNVGNMLLVIIPDTCKEKRSPFGAPDVCITYGIAYASLSLAINQILTWSYVYNIMRRSPKDVSKIMNNETLAVKSLEEDARTNSKNFGNKDCEMFSSTCSMLPDQKEMVISKKLAQSLSRTLSMMGFRYIFTPSTIGVIVGLIIGVSYPIKKLLIGEDAPLRVIQNSTTLLGAGAVPTITLIMGGNFMKGLQKANIKPSLVIGVIIVRYLLLPSFGVAIVKGAVHYGFIHDDPLYQFTLLLHYALPPSVYIGTISQFFGSGESECSVIFLWSFASALFFLPVWLSLFMWLVS